MEHYEELELEVIVFDASVATVDPMITSSEETSPDPTGPEVPIS